MRQSRWAGVAVAACLLLLAPRAGAANNSAYADATADAPSAAPDLASVQVANDDAGTVVFRIGLANRAAMDDMDFVAVLLNADGNVRTGCARGSFGAEFALDVIARRFLFGRCTHGQWNFTRKPVSFGGSFSGGTLVLRVNRRDLGGASAFQFRIGAAAVGGDDASFDFAPDVGATPWAFKVVAPQRLLKKRQVNVKKRLPRCVESPPRACRRR